MKVKVCGMKYRDNILSVAQLAPDYLGFIFYKKSKRYFDGKIPQLETSVKKVGVFVNERIALILNQVERHKLQAVQLHGDESVAYCLELKKEMGPGKELIKAFSISENFNFDKLADYQKACDYFLFDTKGKERGGNGIMFDWNILNRYKLRKPFFLSGGIGLNDIDRVHKYLDTSVSEFCYAIDVNSSFEIEPGLKKTEELKEFIALIDKEIK